MSEEDNSCHSDQLGMRSPIDLTSKRSSLVVSSGEPTLKSIVQDTPVLDPIHRGSLVRIINQLEPSSFLKLARTCRAMHQICFSTKGIEVRYTLTLPLHVLKDVTDKVYFTHKKLYGNNPETATLLTLSEEQIIKLRKMPFRFEMKAYIDVGEQTSSRLLLTLRQYFRLFHRVEIFGIAMVYGTSDWKLLAELLQEFRVIELMVTGTIATPIPENLLFHFATNLRFFIYQGEISDDLIVASTAEFMGFPMARISAYAFKKLLERFAVGVIRSSLFGRQPSAIHDRGRSDPFVMACAEVMKVAQVANVDFIIKDPGVLYWSPDSPREFHLLRADGSTGVLVIELHRVIFVATNR